MTDPDTASIKKSGSRGFGVRPSPELERDEISFGHIRSFRSSVSILSV
ncbi:hypothetical protein LB543_29590 [Mesorhizobium sp. ESP7-2]|nr:hypothetical protein [Mesorhizobium sp. ESP7-2]